jgi:hypothetical protein
VADTSSLFDADELDLLRGWYGVLCGEGRASDKDVELAVKLFRGWACDCDQSPFGPCHACQAVEEAKTC